MLFIWNNYFGRLICFFNLYLPTDMLNIKREINEKWPGYTLSHSISVLKIPDSPALPIIF